MSNIFNDYFIIVLLFAENPNSQFFQLLSRLKYNYASNKQDNRTE